jgi:hypothetical protein
MKLIARFVIIMTLVFGAASLFGEVKAEESQSIWDSDFVKEGDLFFAFSTGRLSGCDYRSNWEDKKWSNSIRFAVKYASKQNIAIEGGFFRFAATLRDDDYSGSMYHEPYLDVTDIGIYGVAGPDFSIAKKGNVDIRAFGLMGYSISYVKEHFSNTDISNRTSDFQGIMLKTGVSVSYRVSTILLEYHLKTDFDRYVSVGSATFAIRINTNRITAFRK